MASESVIKAAIEGIVNNKYSAWSVGVTDDWARRKIEHGYPALWHQWDADTEVAARNVEKCFLDKGMKGGSGGGGGADYVYIFWR